MKSISIALSLFLVCTLGNTLQAEVLYSEEIKASELAIGNTLEWSTLIELDVTEFVIEKSTDGRNFNEIGNLEGAGFSLIDKKYHFLDVNTFDRKAFYRLREISKSGRVGYSLTTVLERKKSSTVQVLAISSPEVTNKFTFTLDALAEMNIDLKLTNTRNQVVLEKTEALVAGINYKSVDFENLEKGTYYITMKYGSTIKKFRVIKTTNKKEVQVPTASSILLKKE